MRRLLTSLLLLAVLVLAWCFAEARADPVVRRTALSLPDWPRGAEQMRVLLWSDIHLGNLATDRVRLERLVAQANALRPDLVVLAGDYLAGHEPADARAAVGLAALARLRAPLGIVAVPGNHEHWIGAGAVRRALERAGVAVLANDAARRGPLAVGGIDDMVTDHESIPRTYRALARVGGARLLVSHSPDIAHWLPGDGVPVLAGHTHCGQVSLPLIGAPVNVSNFGDRFFCGLKRDRGRVVVVGAGTGTSGLPFRLGAPPDWWVVEVGP